MLSIQTMERLPAVKYKTRLKELREKLGMKRMDVVAESYKLGRPVSYQTVSAWEKGLLQRIDADKSYTFRTILGCTLDELLYEVDEDAK